MNVIAIVGVVSFVVGLIGFVQLTRLYYNYYDLYPWFDDMFYKILFILGTVTAIAIGFQWILIQFNVDSTLWGQALTILLPLLFVLVAGIFTHEWREYIVKGRVSEVGDDSEKEQYEAMKGFENPSYGSGENSDIDMAQSREKDIEDVAEKYQN